MSLSSATPGRANSGQNIYFGTAAPVTTDAYGLSFQVGDIVINTSPANGQPIGWICTVAGSPGSWIQFGAATVDVVYSMLANGSIATQPFFNNGTQTYVVTGVTERHSVAGSDGGTVTLDVTNDATTVSPGSGNSVLSAAFNAKATANVTQTSTLSATAANLVVAAGSALSVKLTGTPTSLAGVVVKVVLQKI